MQWIRCVACKKETEPHFCIVEDCGLGVCEEHVQHPHAVAVKATVTPLQCYACGECRLDRAHEISWKPNNYLCDICYSAPMWVLTRLRRYRLSAVHLLAVLNAAASRDLKLHDSDPDDLRNGL